MSTDTLKLGLLAVTFGILGMVGACTSDEVPLDRLRLRDALQSQPSVIHGLPSDARHALALRLEVAHGEQLGASGGSGAVEPPAGRMTSHDASTVAVAVLAFDAVRANRGEDAVIIVSG